MNVHHPEQGEAFFNATYSAGDDFDRFLRCWTYQECGGCMKSSAGCVWCPQSSTCVPLPDISVPLLYPYSKHYPDDPICPLHSERYELRTPTLGCNCSPITLLTAITTCFATLLAILILAFLPSFLRWVWLGLTLRNTGYELLVRDPIILADREGKVWVREREGPWYQFWKQGDGGEYAIESEEVIGDEALEIGRRGWRGVWPFRLVAASKPVRIAEGRLPRVRERGRTSERTTLLS